MPQIQNRKCNSTVHILLSYPCHNWRTLNLKLVALFLPPPPVLLPGVLAAAEHPPSPHGDDPRLPPQPRGLLLITNLWCCLCCKDTGCRHLSEDDGVIRRVQIIPYNIITQTRGSQYGRCFCLSGIQQIVYKLTKNPPLPVWVSSTA